MTETRQATDAANSLAALSAGLELLTEAASRMVASVAAGGGQRDRGFSDRDWSSATLWQPDLLVVSEQVLPAAEVYHVVLPGGGETTATPVGRDPGSNVAALRLAMAHPSERPPTAEPRVGGLALALSGDGAGAATVRLAVLHQVGPAWHSQAGGRIDRRIVLDARLSPTEEGGPVIDAGGRLLGMSTLGPRRRALVIPTATIERVVHSLLAYGKVARGWLGVALQPVAVPEELQAAIGYKGGLMVLGLSTNSPAAAAGVMQGDIMLAVDGQPALRPRALSECLGPDSIGTTASLVLLRAGQTVTVRATIMARP